MNSLLTKYGFAVAVLTANHAFAGGLWLNEFGDFSGGRASAGAAAGTDEAATIIHNPATAGLIKGNQLFGALGVVIPKVQFDVDETRPLFGRDDGGQAGIIAPLASMAYVFDNGFDNWSTGVSMEALSGAGLDYSNNWVGRYLVTDVNLQVLGLGFTLAYQVTDRLSLGIKPQVYYATLEQKLRLPTGIINGGNEATAKIDGDDVGFGGMVGASYEISSATRVGVSWQSKLDINFDGNVKISGDARDVKVNSDTKLPLAQYVRLALHHDLNDKLGLDFTVGWDDWSELKEISISADSGSGSGLPIDTDWQDTYHYAAGFQYKLGDAWDITAGIAYDSSPVSASNRVPMLPVDRQIRYNLGSRYHLSETLIVGGYFNYTDLGSAQINGDNWSGDYSSNEMYQIAVYANWAL